MGVLLAIPSLIPVPPGSMVSVALGQARAIATRQRLNEMRALISKCEELRARSEMHTAHGAALSTRCASLLARSVALGVVFYT